MRRPAAAVLAVLVLAGCVAALREPPPLPERAAGGESEAAEALDLYRTRELEKVRQAAGLLERAIDGESGPADRTIDLARMRIWLAGHEDDPEARRAAATGAVHAGQWCLRFRPGSADCTYWLGAALGVQARERRATAMDALPRIIELFTEARAKDPALDHGGPDRALALLYVRAPGWPTGPGDPDLALEHAEMASALEPEYPPNVLCLAEALHAVERYEGSREAYEKALDLASEAVHRGRPDAGEWVEEARRGLERLR